MSFESIAAKARPEAKEADIKAYDTALRAAPHFSEKERQYVLTVARGEGFYGRGWKQGSGGEGSHNWGAVQGTGPAGFFVHADTHADGSQYFAKYKRYNNDEEGFLDMARIILNGGKRGAQGATEIKRAINKGSLRKAVFAQHDNGYFELNPEKYLDAVMRNYKTISDSLNLKKVLSEKGSSTILNIVGGVLVAVGGIAGMKAINARIKK